MKKAKQKFVVIIIIVLAAYIGNLIFYNYMKLKKPYFLYHDYEVIGNMPFELYLMDNKKEEGKKRIYAASFDDDFMIYLNDQQNNTYDYNNEKYGRIIKSISLSNSEELFYNKLKEKGLPHIFKEITVFYTDGTKESMPIGRIAFKGDYNMGGSKVLQGRMSSSSSDNTTENLIFCNEDVKLLGIDTKYESDLEVYVNETKVQSFPVEAKKGDLISVKNDYNNTKNQARKEGKVILCPIKLSYEMNNEKRIYYVNYLRVIPEIKTMNIKEIDNMLKQKVSS